MSRHPLGWCLVVPVKRLSQAKTRLRGSVGQHRAELALAFALDTTEAALACSRVRAVVAVTDEPEAAELLMELGAVVVADEPDAGLNPALAHGAAAAAAAHPDSGVGALSSDLPALRPAELALVLDRAADLDLSFVPDAAGSGTTLLLARRPADFAPRFGPASAGAHATVGAVDLGDGAIPSLMRDVDTEEDLEEAAALGLGPRTARIVSRLAAHGANLAGPG
jgi:2-phospho-L-lactate/phosphoenolpyruvate guanylyltransferase